MNYYLFITEDLQYQSQSYVSLQGGEVNTPHTPVARQQTLHLLPQRYPCFCQGGARALIDERISKRIAFGI